MHFWPECAGKQTSLLGFINNNSIHGSIQKNQLFSISLTKDIQDLYAENYQTLVRKITDLNKWKGTSYLSI